jgi:hypothetical protein
MRYLLVLFFFPLSVLAEVNSILQSELVEMGVQDQKIRNEVGEAGWNNAPKELLEKLQKIDENNTDKLKFIIKEYSWVTRDLVGVEGVEAAFLIIQHSEDLGFKEQMLPFLKESYLNDEGVDGQQVALLTDRILITQGKKQIYGTQVDLSGGQIIIKPIEDIANVDKRRAEMKMPSLDLYLKLLGEVYGIKKM